MPRLVLQTVALERFKAAFKPEPVSLRPFNVIIGRNGSGKSTLLEALQWLDTTLRQDARVACERYAGIHDLINARSKADSRYFGMRLRWGIESEDPSDEAEPLEYSFRVDESHDGSTPLIHSESLLLPNNYPPDQSVINTVEDESAPASRPGLRFVKASKSGGMLLVNDPDRLALGVVPWVSTPDQVRKALRDPIRYLLDFWGRSVFLRLSPNRLGQGSSATRKSFEPILDEEGRNLPALLNELSDAQREDLVEMIQSVLNDITSVEVSQPANKRDEAVHYILKERMPREGRKGKGVFPLPAWMLSEGTRRLTAICALLVRNPAPSLLCIEEIENGLDPWTVIYVLKLLQSAAERGTQVIVTTHSPWLLDHVKLDDILHVKRSAGDTNYMKFANREEVKAFSATVPPGAAYVNIEDP